MIPGITTRPSASIVRFAPESRPMSVIMPSRMPTSAIRRGSPEPSTTVPPLMIVSSAIRPSIRSIRWWRALPSRRPSDVFELAVGPERPAAAVAADTGALVAAEGGVGVHRAAVDLHGAGAERARDAHAARRVAGPHVAVEAVVGVVGEGDRLVLVGEGDGGDDGAEDLLPGDRHLVAGVGEERRLDVVAACQVRRPAAAAGERGTFGLAARDEALDAVALRGRDERAHHHPGFARIADLDLPREVDEPARELVVDRRFDQEARAGDADLAGMEGPHLGHAR